MTHFIYFGYGSNMLTQRLKKRCGSAQPVGTASVPGYRVQFSKISKDQSGKATLVTAERETVHGVMFRILRAELPALDRAESLGKGYRRDDGFEVLCSRTGETINTTTYIALPGVLNAALKPYDWYHMLLLAGAGQHELPQDYRDLLAGHQNTADKILHREERVRALSVLDEAGYEHGLAYPAQMPAL